MIFTNTSHRIIRILWLASAILLTALTYGFTADSGKKNGYAMTEIELQSELMSYADRFASILTQAVEDFEMLKPTPESRRFILSDTVYSLSAAFSIAAGPNPQSALLDMVVVTTLGRMIYQDNIGKRYGKETEVLAKGYGQLEGDIWRVAEKVLTREQQQELRKLILAWRQRNPDQVVFNYIRFSEFAADRTKSTLVEKGKGGGLFSSIRKVTEQVEEIRMLSERGIFLATRLPLLTGNFAEVWTSQLLVSPDTSKILADVHTFSEASERLANVAEQLPEQLMEDMNKLRWRAINQIMKEVNVWSEVTLNKVMEKVSVEREAFISQFMDRLIGERKNALEELFVQEQRMTGMIGELRQTLTEGNKLLLTADTLAEKFNVGTPSGEPKDSKPFDIKAYRDTVVEVNNLVGSINQLVATIGAEELLTTLVKAIDQVEDEGRSLLDRSFRQGVLLILIGLGGLLVTRLIYTLVSKRLIERRAP